MFLGLGPKNETDEIIDALIDIYGVPITEAMKSLKKRLQEELRKVTRDRKKKLEELEEIRALQVNFFLYILSVSETSPISKPHLISLSARNGQQGVKFNEPARHL